MKFLKVERENFSFQYRPMNRCRLARAPNAAKFRRASTSNVRDFRCRKFVLQEKWTKVHRNPIRFATHQCPLSCQILLRSVKPCTRKVLQFFYTLQYFGAPGGLPEPKFTSRGLDEKQGPVYRSVKFPPVLTTRLRDICCQISSILLTAWPTTNRIRHVSAYHMGRQKASCQLMRKWKSASELKFNNITIVYAFEKNRSVIVQSRSCIVHHCDFVLQCPVEHWSPPFLGDRL